jgi:protein-S-isoprenylcysteine O-methyltransferase Ste14
MSTIEVPAGAESPTTAQGQTYEGPSQAPAGMTPTASRLTPALDWVERLTVLGLYGWLVLRILSRYWAGGEVANLVLLPSEGLVVVFLLIRRPAVDVSRQPGVWALALLATCAPLLATPGGDGGVIPSALAAVVLLIGMMVQIHAKLTLGRSFGCVPANRGLKVAGPYRCVRHPMYAGYLLSHVAFLAMNPTLWNLAVYTLAYALQVPRLLAEERLLGRDPEYRRYQARVPYRLVPGVF